MLKLKNYNVDESKIIDIGGNSIVVDFIPLRVELLALEEITEGVVNKTFFFLFSKNPLYLEISKIPPAKKLEIIKKVLKKEPVSGEEKKHAGGDMETEIDITSMIVFITANTNIPKNDLLNNFTLVELIQLTNGLKGERELPFYTSYRVANSAEQFGSIIS